MVSLCTVALATLQPWLRCNSGATLGHCGSVALIALGTGRALWQLLHCHVRYSCPRACGTWHRILSHPFNCVALRNHIPPPHVSHLQVQSHLCTTHPAVSSSDASFRLPYTQRLNPGPSGENIELNRICRLLPPQLYVQALSHKSQSSYLGHT
jgi:hypothetical protein